MRKLTIAVAVAVLLAAALVASPAAEAQPPPPTTSTIASGIQGAGGSTVGPDGALYVTESATGRILRIDTTTGAKTVFASGLPKAIAPIGGPMDIVFRDGVAYVLVSLVGPFFASPDPTGIYRMDGPASWTVIADLGAWALAHPPGPDIDYFLTTGVHYAIDNFRNGFVVSDAHHNKVLYVTLTGAVTSLMDYPNTVPSGLETRRNQVLIAMSGPTPHLPSDGQIVSLYPDTGRTTRIASGAPLLVDVESGPWERLFGLAQGHFTPGQEAGSPADPNTGELLMVDGKGGFTQVAGGLDRPTSMELIGTTAYVVGLGGDVVRVVGIDRPMYGPN